MYFYYPIPLYFKHKLQFVLILEVNKKNEEIQVIFTLHILM